MANIIIFEGVDKAGKSTAAKVLSEQLSCKVIKGLSAKSAQQLKSDGLQLLESVQQELDNGAQNVIVDRLHVFSDPVYNPVYRDPELVNEVQEFIAVQDILETHLAKAWGKIHNVFLFIFTADADVILKRMSDMGGPEDKLEEHVRDNVNAYLNAYDSLYTALVTRSLPIYDELLSNVVLVDTSSLKENAVVESIAKVVAREKLSENTIAVSDLLKDNRLLFAPIVPKAYKVDSKFALVLAQNLIGNKKQKKYWREFKGYKVLDNGAFELGKSIDLSILLDIAKAINADEIVLPDVFRDKEETIKRTEEAIRKVDYYKKKGLLRPNVKLMAVPQGNDLYEWLTCFETFMRNPKIDVIAINRDSARFYGSRLETLKHVYAGIIAASPEIKKEYHLLGMQDNIHEAKIVAEKYPWVRSIDSCFPYLIAREYAKKQKNVRLDMEAGIARSSIQETINFNAPRNSGIECCLRKVIDVMNHWGINI